MECFMYGWCACSKHKVSARVLHSILQGQARPYPGLSPLAGATLCVRADELADVKVEALAGEVMMQLAMHPSLLVPKV
jgi:hypothetical protein